jgi:para-nitrobenzyl esterase
MTTASTIHGRVRGVEHGVGLRFAGVPFAAPPVGDLRWRPPAPVERWDGVRDATAFGPTAIQNPDMLTAFFGMEPEPQDEDCLFLNVYTPALDDARRPVMVWIHGGAFIIGSGSSPIYDGATLIERGDVVLVSVNYRLGVFGFLDLGWLDPDLTGSGNLGLMDQVAALEWVRDNIAAFGGDPDNVTIFGESAGGMSVTGLLAAESARGLFHKAIAQSGAAQAMAPPAQAETSAREVLAALGVSTLDELGALSNERLLEVQGQIILAALTNVEPMLEGGVSAGLPFRPVADGGFLPTSVLGALRGGSAAGIPVITGTTREEWKLFAMLDFQPIDDAVLRQRLDALTGDADKALAVYADAVAAGPSLKDAFTVIGTDMVFRYPAVELAEALLQQSPDVWEYQFSWGTSAMNGMLGACHAIELPFLFGLASDPRLLGFLGDDPPVGLAEAVQDAWLAFARAGDPGPDWPRYDLDRRAVRTFDADLGILEDPGAAQREFWATVDL